MRQEGESRKLISTSRVEEPILFTEVLTGMSVKDKRRNSLLGIQQRRRQHVRLICNTP